MPPPLRTQVDQLLQKITEVIGEAAGIRGRQVAPQQRELLVERTRELKRALDASVYPHPLPPAVFDPADTRLFGRFAAIALVAQERIALKDVEHIYGSGVYALYYLGPRPEYAPISGTETPVYVGKTQPKAGANAAVEQGTAITSRLGTHRTAITNAVNLDIDDFECRYLVVAAGWETPAETELIRYFKPVWNKDIGPVHGIGKHGDSSTTRANRRSPWDTFHPGRRWAKSTAADQRSTARIIADIAYHFRAYPPVKSRQAVIDDYVDMLVTPASP